MTPAFSGRPGPVRQDDLEDVALPDVALGPLDHPAAGLPVEQRRDLAQQAAGLLLLLLPGAEQLAELFELEHGFVVAGFRVLKRHIDDQNDLLTEVVKRDHLVKKHEIDVLERLGILHVGPHGGFAVTSQKKKLL